MEFIVQKEQIVINTLNKIHAKLISWENIVFGIKTHKYAKMY